MIKPNLFATPVWTIKLDKYKDINEEMYKYIKLQQNNDKDGINKSNIKGWHQMILTLMIKLHKISFHLYQIN